MQTSDRVEVELGRIRLGATSRYDIHDRNGMLLLARGQAFTADVRDRLQRRDILALEVSADEAERLLGAATEGKRGKSSKTREKKRYDRRRRADRRDQPLNPDRAKAFRQQIATGAAAVYMAAERMGQLNTPEVSQLCQIPSTLISMLMDDCDQAAALVSERKDPRVHLAQRCIRMSVLAINTGIEMGLPESQWVTLGTAGLLHDLALFQGPACFRLPGSLMTQDERWQYRLHPRLVADTLEGYGLITEEVCVIMHQVHERDDGTGYPRGLAFNALHPLSRVLHVVDAYLSLVEPGPGRPPLMPHDAIRLMIREAEMGSLPRDVAEAFFDQMSHYPVGSEVELDDGNRAQVIRRDGPHRDTPVVQVFGEHHTLRLSRGERRITAAVVPHGSREMKLDEEDLSTLDLSLFGEY